MTTKNKPLIVLVHGLRGSHHGLRFVAEALSDDFEVLTPDIPGSGENAELEKQDLAGHVEWLHGYVAALPKKPIMVGHSMGSIIVSNYVAKYPEDVQNEVILMSPIFRSKWGQMSGRIMSGGLTVAMLPFSAKQRHKILASRKVSWMISHFLTCDKEKQKFIDEEHFAHSGKFTSARALMGDIRTATTREVKSLDNKRVLMIIGEGDKLTNCRLAAERAEKSGAKLDQVLRAGHLLNYEVPEKVAKKIKQFLKTS